MAFSFQPKVVSDGLIFCVDAANTKSYLGSGTVWTDLSSTQITGSLTNGPVFSTEKSGIINFDGTNDYVGYTTTLGNNVSTLTIESWAYIKRTPVGLISDHLVSKGTSGNYQYALRLGIGIGDGLPSNVSGSINIVAWQTGGSNHISATSNFAVNDGWHHIVGTIVENTSATIYIDGVLRETRTGSTGSWNKTGTGEFRIGGRGDGVNYLSGSVGIVKMYNRALSATEVLQNYNALKGRFGLT
jgi:hypothetical protein